MTAGGAAGTCATGLAVATAIAKASATANREPTSAGHFRYGVILPLAPQEEI